MQLMSFCVYLAHYCTFSLQSSSLAEREDTSHPLIVWLALVIRMGVDAVCVHQVQIVSLCSFVSLDTICNPHDMWQMSVFFFKKGPKVRSHVEYAKAATDM